MRVRDGEAEPREVVGSGVTRRGRDVVERASPRRTR